MSAARATRNDGFPLYPLGSLPADARTALVEIEAMSRMNRADTPLERTDRSSPPWLVALASLLRGATWDSRWPLTVPHVLHVDEGDRPTDLTDREIRDAETWEPEYRPRPQVRDRHALLVREFVYDRGIGDGYAARVRETHTLVHHTLAGETAGGTIPGCPWCERIPLR